MLSLKFIFKNEELFLLNKHISKISELADPN